MRSTGILYNCSVPISSEYIHHTSRYTLIIVICMYTCSCPLFSDQHKIAQVLAEFIVPLVSHLIWSQDTWSHPPRSFGSSSSQEHCKWSLEKKKLMIPYIGDRSPLFRQTFFHPNHQVLSPLLCNVSWWIQIPLRSPFQGAEFESRATSNLHLFYTFSDIYPRLGLGTTIKRPKTFYLSIRSSDLFFPIFFSMHFHLPNFLSTAPTQKTLESS